MQYSREPSPIVRCSGIQSPTQQDESLPGTEPRTPLSAPPRIGLPRTAQLFSSRWSNNRVTYLSRRFHCHLSPCRRQSPCSLGGMGPAGGGLHLQPLTHCHAGCWLREAFCHGTSTSTFTVRSPASHNLLSIIPEHGGDTLCPPPSTPTPLPSPLSHTCRAHPRAPAVPTTVLNISPQVCCRNASYYSTSE